MESHPPSDVHTIRTGCQMHDMLGELLSTSTIWFATLAMWYIFEWQSGRDPSVSIPPTIGVATKWVELVEDVCPLGNCKLMVKKGIRPCCTLKDITEATKGFEKPLALDSKRI